MFIVPRSQTKSASLQLRPRQTETRWTWRPSVSSPRSSLLPSPVSSTLPKNCPCFLRWVMVNGPEDQRPSMGVCLIQRAIKNTEDKAKPLPSCECVSWGNVYFKRSICLAELAVPMFEEDHNDMWYESYDQYLQLNSIVGGGGVSKRFHIEKIFWISSSNRKNTTHRLICWSFTPCCST